MAGKGQFAARGEDADVVAGALVRRQEEDRLGEVQPGGEGLHGGGIQAIAVEDDTQRVAAAGAVGEDVQLQVTAFAHGVRVGQGRPA